MQIRDLKSLPEPILAEFKQGNFAISKSGRRFSRITLDMRHEHNNKGAKEDGGIIGMTGDQELLQKWLVSGSELSRLINQFEEIFLPEDPEEEGFHHSEEKSYQIRFQTKVKMVVETINKFGNPFIDTFHELVTLVVNIRNLKDIGKKQYSNYYKAVLEEKTASIHNPIKRNRLHLPKVPVEENFDQRWRESTMSEK